MRSSGCECQSNRLGRHHQHRTELLGTSLRSRRWSASTFSWTALSGTSECDAHTHRVEWVVSRRRIEMLTREKERSNDERNPIASVSFFFFLFFFSSVPLSPLIIHDYGNLFVKMTIVSFFFFVVVFFFSLGKTSNETRFSSSLTISRWTANLEPSWFSPTCLSSPKTKHVRCLCRNRDW